MTGKKAETITLKLHRSAGRRSLPTGVLEIWKADLPLTFWWVYPLGSRASAVLSFADRSSLCDAFRVSVLHGVDKQDIVLEKQKDHEHHEDDIH